MIVCDKCANPANRNVATLIDYEQGFTYSLNSYRAKSFTIIPDLSHKHYDHLCRACACELLEDTLPEFFRDYKKKMEESRKRMAEAVEENLNGVE